MSQKLQKVLEKLTGGYCETAPEDAAYPYAVFSAARLGEEDGKQSYHLEINVWDKNLFYSRAESLMDALEQKLHRCSFRRDGFLIRIFNGRRQNIPDPDRSIRRVRAQFEMLVYERED